MENNQIIKFIQYINENRDSLYQEFLKSEEVQKLLKPDRVKTFFQPILTLKLGATVAFEILNRPENTPLFPTTDKFYDYVGRSNYAFQVERFIRSLALERYTEQVKTLKEPLSKLVFLNIQPQVLADPHYQSGITLELLAKYNLSPNQIVLELTEREAAINHNQFVRIIEHYREQGFRIAVDDAGTGYNSLQTLLYLKPEFIKIDKSLIRDIEEQQEKQYLVELILEFASKSSTKVIAEGIETTSELNFLQHAGVDMGQGYALGRPMPQLCKGTMPTTTNLASPFSL